ncbi:MAG: hypothetical protein DYH07_02815 [Armatimonadetes bacterium ATM1]|nr:MAG: hypothetical protein EDM73_01000 [Armatimonadota bacterium]MBC6969736.1 hypothetical protein [Armatimonadota bacterium]MCE7899004.1 hypothetical protein [Armatimonadetes bacterium ATM1]RIJ96045.1 MAG: hypothetical protein DCC45_09315 [Armatimonadota bacterium]
MNAILLAIALVSTWNPSYSVAERQSATMKIKRIERMNRAVSKEELLAEYQKTGLSFRRGNLACSGMEYSWFAVDEGSGSYLIHVFLYEERKGKADLVLHLTPESNRVSIEPRAEKDRILFLARTKQAPNKEFVVAQYFVKART